MKQKGRSLRALILLAHSILHMKKKVKGHPSFCFFKWRGALKKTKKTKKVAT